MPLPIAAALPWIGSAVGAMLPAIVDMFRSGKSPEEAAQIVAPKRQEIVDRLIGTGMNQAAAEAMADESIKGELAQAQLPEPMNPWLTGVLMLGGGIAGAKLGSMAKARLSPSAGAPATPKTNPADAAPPASAPTKPSMADAETMAAQRAGRPVEMRDEILADLEPRVSDTSVRRIGYAPGSQSPIEAGYSPATPFPPMATGGERLAGPPMLARLGYKDPTAGGMVGEMAGTPATATPFPASVQRRMDRMPAVRSAQTSEAFEAKRAMEEQIRRQQMEREWEQQALLSSIAG